MPLFLNIRNPISLDAEGENFVEFKSELEGIDTSGHDGIIIEKLDDNIDGHYNANHFVAFSSNQIKSAIDNIGSFDSGNPDIRFQGGRYSSEGPLGWLKDEAYFMDYDEFMEYAKEATTYSEGVLTSIWESEHVDYDLPADESSDSLNADSNGIPKWDPLAFIEDENGNLIETEEEYNAYVNRKASEKKLKFYNTRLKSDEWLSLDVNNLSTSQRDERFKELINTDVGLDDFVTILRAGARYYIDGGHWDVVSEAYGTGKMTRKKKWFPPEPFNETEGKILQLASDLNVEIRNHAYNYAYSKGLTDKTRKMARTNILKNSNMYQSLLSKVFAFFYQESFLQNQPSFLRLSVRFQF